jgi:hypothetical protein
MQREQGDGPAKRLVHIRNMFCHQTQTGLVLGYNFISNGMIVDAYRKDKMPEGLNQIGPGKAPQVAANTATENASTVERRNIQLAQIVGQASVNLESAIAIEWPFLCSRPALD